MRFITNVPADEFVALLAHAACLVGNSSAGIKECSFLGTPVVNIGARQQGRTASAHAVNVAYQRDEIAQAMRHPALHRDVGHLRRGARGRRHRTHWTHFGQVVILAAHPGRRSRDHGRGVAHRHRCLAAARAAYPGHGGGRDPHGRPLRRPPGRRRSHDPQPHHRGRGRRGCSPSASPSVRPAVADGGVERPLPRGVVVQQRGLLAVPHRADALRRRTPGSACPSTPR